MTWFRRKIIVLLFAASTNLIFSQDQKDIQFVQEAIPQLIQNELKYILIYELAYKPDTFGLKVALADYISDEKIQEFIEKIKQTKSILIWKKHSFHKSKIIAQSKRRKQYEKISKDWTLAFKRFYKFYNLTEEEYENEDAQTNKRERVPSDFRKLRLEERQIYHFGFPIFSDNDQFALISFGISKGSLNAIGWTCLFEKIENHWVLRAKLNSWVS
jgi:hypothetical protein